MAAAFGRARLGSAGAHHQTEAIVSEDPYHLLGVPRTAKADEIRAAYRKLARKLHPDLNPGDRTAEERFKKITAAYDLLGDAEKRARFDRGEIDADGTERPPRPEPPPWTTRRGAEGYADPSAYADLADQDELLAELLGRGFGRRRGGAGIKLRGHDIQARLEVPFLAATLGSTQRITLPDGGTVDVKVPPGTRDGDVLRLGGKGGEGIGGGASGDLLITIHLAPHPRFRREGDDILFDLPVSLADAVLGAKLEVEAPGGRVRLSVPAGSNSGSVLRLRGRGVPRAGNKGGEKAGDALARLVVMLPDPPDPALRQFVESWARGDAGEKPETQE